MIISVTKLPTALLIGYCGSLNVSNITCVINFIHSSGRISKFDSIKDFRVTTFVCFFFFFMYICYFFVFLICILPAICLVSVLISYLKDNM